MRISRRMVFGLVAAIMAMSFTAVLPIGEASAAAGDTYKSSAKNWCSSVNGNWVEESDTKALCKGIEETEAHIKDCSATAKGITKNVGGDDNKFRCVWNGKFKDESELSGQGDGTTYGSGVGKVYGGVESDPDCGDGVKTSILGDDGCYNDDGKGGGVYDILLIILNILTAGVGVLGVLGLIISGVTYLTARDNEQQVAKAKSRILQIVIGLVVYAVLYLGLQFIIPGGIFGN
ncbi:hypothetical protein IJH02_02900 [Candidatus Saccharibacteria bacterium]|nr:hypothetical protein [Candidatus Saccharibacteria bacterium]